MTTEETTVVASSCFKASNTEYFFISDLKTFLEASEDCRARKGILAKITNQKEHDFVSDLFSQTTIERNYYIGLVDQNFTTDGFPEANFRMKAVQDLKADRFTYVDGDTNNSFYQKSNAFPWLFDEPSDDGDCVSMTDSNSKWKVSHCMSDRPYLCQRTCQLFSDSIDEDEADPYTQEDTVLVIIAPVVIILSCLLGALLFYLQYRQSTDSRSKVDHVKDVPVNSELKESILDLQRALETKNYDSYL